MLRVAPLERIVDEYTQGDRRKEFFARAGPVLLVATFLEDGARMILKHDEQFRFLSSEGYLPLPTFLSKIIAFLWIGISIAVQLGGGALLLHGALLQRPATFSFGGRPMRLGVKEAAYALLAFVLVQPFVYGHFSRFEVGFVCRAVTLTGGFILLIAAEKDRERKEADQKNPSGDFFPSAKGTHAEKQQLWGRMLLTFLFLFESIAGDSGGLHAVMTRPTVWNVLSTVLLLSCSALLCVGFKTEPSAILLTIVLGVANFFMYPFWGVGYPIDSLPDLSISDYELMKTMAEKYNPHLADVYRYYFFQTFSVMGGLLLLARHGPGGISVDRKKD